MDAANPPALVMGGEEEEFSGGGDGSFELTRSNSGADSSISVENSGDGLHLSVNGRPDGSAWTNEMHNKFLDSLEASFVQQLHRSTSSLAWGKEHKRSGKGITQRFPSRVNKASGQFDNSRDGGWHKPVFEKDRPLLYNGALEIPWMHCQELAEGSGQNFVDKDCEVHTNLFSLAMQSKTAVGDA